MTVNVKTVARRTLRFESLDDILRDVETITAGPHRTTGNWTAAQIIEHLALFVEIAGRGSDIRFPWHVRAMGRVLKWMGFHKRVIKPGLKPPVKIARAIASPPDVPVGQAVDHLRREVAYADQHGMTHPSPLFGPLNAEDWRQLQCRHAEMHLGFVHPG